MSDTSLFSLKAAEYGHLFNWLTYHCVCGWAGEPRLNANYQWGKWSDHVIETIATLNIESSKELD